MQQAIDIAKMGPLTGDLPIAALVLDESGEVIAGAVNQREALQGARDRGACPGRAAAEDVRVLARDETAAARLRTAGHARGGVYCDRRVAAAPAPRTRH